MSVGRFNVDWPAPDVPCVPSRMISFPVGVHLVEHVRCRVDDPDVALRIDAYGMRAARRASRWSIHGRVARPIGREVLFGNAGDLALADQPVAPRAEEFSGAVELEHRMGAAVQHEHGAARVDGDTRRLNQIPRRGKPCGAGRRCRPFDELVTCLSDTRVTGADERSTQARGPTLERNACHPPLLASASRLKEIGVSYFNRCATFAIPAFAQISSLSPPTDR